VPNVQWKTPDDEQRNCPKQVEFLDKNKFGEIIASVGFIKKKIGYDARSHESKICEHRLLKYTCGHVIGFCFVPLAKSLHERLKVPLLGECRTCVCALEGARNTCCQIFTGLCSVFTLEFNS